MREAYFCPLSKEIRVPSDRLYTMVIRQVEVHDAVRKIELERVENENKTENRG